MEIEALKKRNEAKTEDAAERGPVRNLEGSAPIGDAILAFSEGGDLPFAIPALRPLHSGVRPRAADGLGDAIDYLEQVVTAGGAAEGAADVTLEAFGVVAA